MTKAGIITIALAAATVISCGCGGDTGGDASEKAQKTQTDRATEALGEAAHPTKGIGPIANVDVASLDRSLAARGSEVFQTKCTACHKMEERYVGPALKGVTERRAPEWIMNMILNPDEMVKQDPQARKLLSEYIAPMTNQNLTEEEARSVLVYFLEYDEKATE